MKPSDILLEVDVCIGSVEERCRVSCDQARKTILVLIMIIEGLVEGKRLKIGTGNKGVGWKVWILGPERVDLRQRVIDRVWGDRYEV